MPVVTLTVFDPYTEETVQKLLHAAAEELAAAFEHPVSSITCRAIRCGGGYHFFGAGRSKPSLLLEITCFPGRSRAAKEALYDAFGRRAGEIVGGEVHLLTIFDEPPRENWVLSLDRSPKTNE